MLMNPTLEELEQKAKQLSADDRAQLALFLLQSLESADEGDIDEMWRAESERRLVQVESGEVQSVPGDEVFARVRRRLG
jgi:putative addiction module component (TIGR02574 family)